MVCIHRNHLRLLPVSPRNNDRIIKIPWYSCVFTCPIANPSPKTVPQRSFYLDAPYSRSCIRKAFRSGLRSMSLGLCSMSLELRFQSLGLRSTSFDPIDRPHETTRQVASNALITGQTRLSQSLPAGSGTCNLSII